MADSVRIWRIFTRDDGSSSMEAIDLPVEATARGGGTSKLLAGEGVQVRRIAQDIEPAWHTAPRRQLTATISGEGEIETSDGQVIHLEPGVVLLLEDLTGQGHITRTLGDSDRLALFMPLDAETAVP